MATMKTLNGYGFNATELNGKAASDYLQKTDTATNSAKLGGKAPEYYIQPRNLLDNSDFRNPVNQRGQTSYAGNFIYTVDRWQSGDGMTTLAIQDDGVKVYSGSGTMLPYIYQKLEKLRAGTYTFAAKFHSNTSSVAVSNYLTDNGATVPTTNENNGIIVLTFSTKVDFGSDKAWFRLQGTTNDNSVVWEWAALYEGSYTADTLPPYVPKGYAAELAECMRYYQKFQMLTGTSANAAQRVFIVLPVAMRITPTIDYELITGEQPNNVVAQARNVIDVTGAASYSHLSISLSADL